MTETKIKLLVLTNTYEPKIDGVLTFVKEFMKRAKDDFDLRIVAPAFSRKKIFTKTKTTLLPLSERVKFFNYQSIKPSRANKKRIKKEVKEADVIFIQELAPIGYYGLKYAKKYKKKIIYYVHNTPWEFIEKYYDLGKILRKLLRLFMIRLYNKADILLVPFHDYKDQLKKEGVKKPIAVARLGVDIKKFSPIKQKDQAKKRLKISPKKTVIGYVGRVSPEKNILTLAKAFKKLENQEKLHLLIVGDGNKDIVKELKKIHNCTVTGVTKEVDKYLKAMDIFVMPSLTETTSLATLEAMASGLPIVATKVGFIKNYIVKNHNGLFFPRENPDHLKIKLQRLLNDEELRENIAHNARKTVAYGFSWERSINRIKRIIKQEFFKHNKN